MSRPYKCTACGSHRTVCKGYRVTKTMGKRRLRLCRDCGRKFTPQNQQYLDYDDQADTNQPGQICDTESSAESPALQHDHDQERDDGHNSTGL